MEYLYMKKLNLTSVLIIVSLILTCCDNGTSKILDFVPTLVVTDAGTSHNIKLSEIYKDFEYIPLETNEECIIGQPTKIILYDNKFYILDPRKAKAIFVFSSDGRFIRKFSKMGRGPGEFARLEDFCIEPGTNNIVILDDNIFLKYFKEDGTYIKTIRISFPAMRFDFPDENHISFVPGGNEDYLIITDKEGKRKSSFFKYADETHLILNLPFIHNRESGLLFLTNLDYTIYKIDGEKIYPHIKINFGKNMFNPKDIDLLKANPKNVDNYYRIHHYFETPSSIVILCIYMGEPYYIIFNKVSKKMTFVNYNEVENDITYTKLSPTIWANDSNEKHVSYVSAVQLKNNIVNKNKINPELLKIINNLKITDNPVLLLLKIK
jgi:hypothetical protein